MVGLAHAQSTSSSVCAHQYLGVPAQAYVALSRARSMEGLQVLDFASGCVKV